MINRSNRQLNKGKFHNIYYLMVNKLPEITIPGFHVNCSKIKHRRKGFTFFWFLWAVLFLVVLVIATACVTPHSASFGKPKAMQYITHTNASFSGSWTKVNISSGWEPRIGQAVVALSDGSIVLMGGMSGHKNHSYYNDTWRSADKGKSWSLMNASCGWESRAAHTAVTLPDGSIVLMGGQGFSGFFNDTWRSTDKGSTWTLMNGSSGWSTRVQHTSVAMPDGNIVLMGGYDNRVINDVWRSTDNGLTWDLVDGNAEWSKRRMYESVTTPEGGILLMGGFDDIITYFNDVWWSADDGTTWKRLNKSAGWKGRIFHKCIVMPDGRIVLMGGELVNGDMKNDVWQSSDRGITWTLVNESAGWYPEIYHTVVALPDGSITLLVSNPWKQAWHFTPDLTDQ